MSGAASPFASIQMAPPDPILGLTEAYNADPNPDKVNLGVGVYLDGAGKVPVLHCVREAARRLLESEETKTYLPIDGAPAYNRQVQQLLLGEGSPVIAEGRAITVQCLGGTGALRVGADLLVRHLGAPGVWISTPSWENHRGVFEAAGLKVQAYPYYDPAKRGLDFDAMVAGLKAIPAGDVVVLHACCHNPSGVDLSASQWATVVEVCGEQGLLPFLDFAYQGFAVGLDQDALAVRSFAASGQPFIVANSFSKNFSLYRERVGGLTVITAGADEAKRTLSQVKRIIRTNYSNPASHGAQIVATVLADAQLRPMWTKEVGLMRERIAWMRKLFARSLAEAGIEKDYSFVTRQKGMFSFLGLPVEAVHRLRSEFGVYAVDSSRVCVAAMNEQNIQAICRAIAAVSAEA